MSKFEKLRNILRYDKRDELDKVETQFGKVSGRPIRYDTRVTAGHRETILHLRVIFRVS